MPYLEIRYCAWVPLPAPGRPRRSMRMSEQCRNGCRCSQHGLVMPAGALSNVQKRRSIAVFKRLRNAAAREHLLDPREIGRRIDPRMRSAPRDLDADLESMRQRAQLLERFELFDRCR